MPPINYLSVVVAAIASMVIGSIWYGPYLFGKVWMELSGHTPDPSKGQPSAMIKSYSIMFVGSLLMAFVLDHALIYASTYTLTVGVPAGLMVGFWNWLGFIAPVTLGTVLWEGKSWKLWFLNNGYYLVTLLVMGIILALWV